MARGPGGYGRYDDDPGHVGCPRAVSDMTPCVARDGQLALTDAPEVCVGCAHPPGFLLAEFGDDYGPARRYKYAQPRDPAACAARFATLVREATAKCAHGASR